MSRDYVRHATCTSPANLGPASVQDYQRLKKFHDSAYNDCLGFVKEIVQRTPMREEYHPEKAMTQTVAEWILAQGRDYTRMRLRAMIMELIQMRSWVLYYRTELANEKNPDMIRLLIRLMGEKSEAFIAHEDKVRYLRYRYSIMTPPSVPAPSATTTDPGSTGSCTEEMPPKKRVRPLKRVLGE